MGNRMLKCAVVWSLALAVSTPALALQYHMRVPQYQPLSTSDGAEPGAARVRAAIVDAARVRRWETVASEPGRLTLRYAPRTHEVVIAVRYDDRGFLIEYVSSKDMDYQVRKGETFIHGNYNVWIENLAENIAASRILLPEGERGELPDDVIAAAVPLSTVKLVAPVRVHPLVPYRPGLGVREAVSTQCDWNRQFTRFMAEEADGLVEVTDTDLDAAPGYALKLSVVNMHAGKPHWAVVRADLYDNGRLIGRIDQRRTTMAPLSRTCSAMEDIAQALASDTVEWLRRGQFEVKLNPADTLPEIGEAETVPSIQQPAPPAAQAARESPPRSNTQ